jgi:DNA-directed RNA polymerase specialized sigma24 family protein
MAQREIQRVVEHAIDELLEAFRLVFVTRVIEGMNVEETAEILELKLPACTAPAPCCATMSRRRLAPW